MPNYEYECERCPRTFEIRQRISEAALTSCPTCGGPVRRLIAAAPFILKGGGWYVTDYPSEARKKGMESEKKASTPAETAPTAAAGTQASSTPTSAPTSTTTPSTGTSGSSGAAAASSSSK
ncbi:MAG TPA: FmdB family zinc ribbon protein [Methylomirabilota bacterium]|nr:FmdB family zinc ribbon protein [Methylomirabilota bacterium]